MERVADVGYLSPQTVFIDGIHIKASANTKKQVKAVTPVASKRYAQELMAQANANLEAHSKAPLDDEEDQPVPPQKCRDNTSQKPDPPEKGTENPHSRTVSFLRSWLRQETSMAVWLLMMYMTR